MAKRKATKKKADTGRFIPAKDELTGKRAASVAAILEKLADSGAGNPVPLPELLEAAENDISQMGPAMLALELAGVVDRFTYSDGGTKRRQAFALTENGEVQ